MGSVVQGGGELGCSPHGPSCRQQPPNQPTQPREITRQRKLFWQWIRGPGSVHRDPSGASKYVQSTHKVYGHEDKDRPFPPNPEFKSQPVVSEEGRELIWKSVMEEGQPIKAVSARFSVDMRRVAAVLRMKEIEKQWKAEVSSSFPLSSVTLRHVRSRAFQMMIQIKIRLVLKT